MAPTTPARQPHATERWLTAVPLAILGFAFALRVAEIGDRPLWFDEGYSIYFAGVSPLETAQLTAIDIHPPLYYWLLQLWTLLVGWNPVSVRMFSVFVGVLTVAVTFAFGKSAFGRRTAWLAAAALAVSPLHVAYSQEIRMYALLALLAVIATWSWWLLPRRRNILVYCAAMVGATLSQYYGAYLFVAQALTLPLLSECRHRLVALVVAVVPLVIWFAYAGPQLLGYVQTKVQTEGYPVLDPWSFVSGFGSAVFGGDLLGSIAAVLMLAFAIVGLVRPARPIGVLLAVSVATPLALGYLVNLVFPFSPPGWQRLFLFVVPLWLLLAAHGAARLTQAFGRQPVAVFAGGAIAAVILLASMLGVARQLADRPADDPREMIRVIERDAIPSDLFLAVYPWQIGYLRMYDRRPLPEIQLAPSLRWSATPSTLANDLAELTAGRRTWMPAYQRLGHILEDRIESRLSETLYRVAADWYGDHRLIFAASAATPAERTENARFGALQLVGARVNADPVPSATGVVPVELRWRGAVGPADVHLRLANAAGVTWAQHDGPLSADRPDGVDRRGILIPAGTPPGAYQIWLSVSTNGETMTAQSGSASPAPELSLGPIVVGQPAYPVPVESLAIGRPQRVDAGDGLTFLGSDFGAGPYRPGDTVLASLYWMASSAQSQNQSADLVIGDGRASGTIGGSYQTANWIVGDPVREVRQVIVRNPGTHQVMLSVGGRTLALGTVQVTPRERQADPPVLANTINARFDNQIQLVGASLHDARGGGLSSTFPREIDVDLVWRSDRPIDDDLAVFVHLVGPDGRPLAQHDSRPANNAAPTRGWLPGELVVDRHRLSIPATVPAGDYQIAVGLYRPPAGPRLSSASGESVTIASGRLD